MWPFKKKQKKAESPQEIAALAKLDDATDEAAAEELDQAFALRGLGRASGGLAMAGAFDRERLIEKADEVEEHAKQ